MIDTKRLQIRLQKVTNLIAPDKNMPQLGAGYSWLQIFQPIFNEKINLYPKNTLINRAIQTGYKIRFFRGKLHGCVISRSELPDNCVDRDYDLFNS